MLASLLFGVIAGIPSAMGGEFVVPWVCPQTAPLDPDAGMDLPELEYVHFTFNPGAKTLESEDWSLNRSIAQQSDVDYFPCVWNFQWRLQQALQEECEKSVPPGEKEQCTKTWVPKAMTPIRLDSASTGEAALKNGAVPAAVPLEPIYPSPRLDALEKQLTQNCNISDWELNAFSPLLLSSTFIQERLPRVMKATSPSCHRWILSKLLRTLAMLQPSAEACPEESRARPCVIMRSASRRLLQALRPYDDALDTQAMKPASQALEACLPQKADFSLKLIELSYELHYADDCIEPRWTHPPEPPRLIHRADVGGGLGAHYKLSRTGPSSYGIEVNLVFSPDEVGKATREHLEACLKAANPYLKGPNGQSLEIRLSDPNDKDPAPKIPIQIDPEIKRSYMSRSGQTPSQWGTEVECSTMLHETLHTLGLVDEYAEVNDGFDFIDEKRVLIETRDINKQANFSSSNCRAVGPDNSMMNNHWRAFEELGIPQKPWETGTASKSAALPPPAEAQSQPRRASLLMPAEFQALTHPGCFPKNKNYYLCARRAYDTSRGNFGSGCSIPLPPACQGGSTDWVEKVPPEALEGKAIDDRLEEPVETTAAGTARGSLGKRKLRRLKPNPIPPRGKDDAGRKGSHRPRVHRKESHSDQ